MTGALIFGGKRYEVQSLAHLQTRADFAAAIGSHARKAVQAIVDAGATLIAAKDKLEHGEFTAMIEADLPFSPEMARKYMKIASSDVIANQSDLTVLPPALTTLYDIARLPADDAQQLIRDRVIHPDMSHNDIRSHVKQTKRTALHAGLAAESQRALEEIGQKKYAVGVFDPHWKTEARSEKGMLKSADNHYPTATPEEIMAMPIPDMMLDDSILFLWATMPLLDRQIKCLTFWGYRYVSQWVWYHPDQIGSGYWARKTHELLLIGRKGEKVGCPPEGQRQPSVWNCRRGQHSEKPDQIYDYIAHVYQGLPLVEGFAIGKRPGWDVWGNQAGDGGADS